MKRTLNLILGILVTVGSRMQVAGQPLGNGAGSPPQQQFQASDLVLVASEAGTVRKELEKKVRPLVKAEDFKQLDVLANELRVSKKETASGTWHLKLFYGALCDFPDEA